MKRSARSESPEANAGSASTPVAGPIPVFLDRTYAMVDNAENNDVISWSELGNSFIVTRVDALEALLPLYFSHANFLSFVRQLNFYGFSKVKGIPRLKQAGDGAAQETARASSDSCSSEKQNVQGSDGSWEFMHPSFQRGCKHLLVGIKRRKDKFNTKNGQARAQVDKLKEFKEDMELVTNWMKKVEEKVDDIAAILMRAYGGATSDAGIFPRAFPPDERGRHDPYAEPPPAAVSLAPREPLMDNELRQRRDLDEGRYQQRSQYYHAYSAQRLPASSAPSSGGAVSISSMTHRMHGGQGARYFERFATAEGQGVGSSSSRRMQNFNNGHQLPASSEYPHGEKNLPGVMSPPCRPENGGSPAYFYDDWGGAAHLPPPGSGGGACLRVPPQPMSASDSFGDNVERRDGDRTQGQRTLRRKTNDVREAASSAPPPEAPFAAESSLPNGTRGRDGLQSLPVSSPAPSPVSTRGYGGALSLKERDAEQQLQVAGKRRSSPSNGDSESAGNASEAHRRPAVGREVG